MKQLYRSDKLADEVEDVLTTLLQHDVHPDVLSDTYSDRPDIERVQTFGDYGLVSADRGIVITLKDGSEIHLTITAHTPEDESL